MEKNGGEDELFGALFASAPLVHAAHELKSPLALIRQLGLGLELDATSEEERKKLVRQIILTSERALRLTTDLTRSSRLDDSLFTLEPLNPLQVCEEAAHELYPLYRAKGRELRVRPSRRPPLVVANRDLLRRIVLGFGDNALHYGDEGKPVEIKASVARESVRIGVRDFGPSIRLEAWRQLQEGLGTHTQNLHSRPQSSGLGLFVAGRFARAMQGNIGATRHRDGVTFYVEVAASRQLSLL